MRSEKLYTGNENYIYVSYCTGDADRVLSLVDTMSSEGYRLWYDGQKSSEPASLDAVAQRLNDAAAFIAFISAEAVNSFDFLREINFALMKNKKFLAVFLEETQLSVGMEMQLAGLPSLKKYGISGDAFINELEDTGLFSSCIASAVPAAPAVPVAPAAKAVSEDEDEDLDIKSCPVCGAGNLSKYKFCARCGSVLPAAEKKPEPEDINKKKAEEEAERLRLEEEARRKAEEEAERLRLEEEARRKAEEEAERLRLEEEARRKAEEEAERLRLEEEARRKAEEEAERLRLEEEARRKAEEEAERLRLEEEARRKAEEEAERLRLEEEARRKAEEEAERLRLEEEARRKAREAELAAAPKADGKMICSSCGAEVKAGYKFCSKCGGKPVPAAAPAPVAAPAPAAAANICSSCSSVIPEGYKFCIKCGTPVTAEPAPSAVYSGDERTVMAPVNKGYHPTTRYCIERKKNGVIVDIKPGMFVIGRSESMADMVIEDNKTIGRKHAFINLQNDGCFLVDNDSLNKTRLNGMVLKPNVSYGIKDGDVIRLSDEEFIFRVIKR